jgi:monovalent cation/hydrogen antiporter
MDVLTIVVSLLLLLTLCSSVLRRFSIPYSTVMVLVGAAIAFIPGLPAIKLPPELVLLVFLPPLLYSDAWYVTWHEFRNELPGILSLSALLVMATMTSVAVVANALIPGMSWGVAFVLGAILSPTDAIAAAPIAHRMGLPRRLVVLIEGEGLVNDAAAIVAYRFAVAAVVTGVFSSTDAMTVAGISTVGGIVIGLLAGWLSAQAHRVTADARLETVITMLTPFVAYIPAEQMHLSGVLAVVTAGLYIGYRQAKIFTAETRLQAIAVWDVITFLLNGLIFVLIGLQLPRVLEGVASYGVSLLALYAGVVCAAVVMTRGAWLYVGAASSARCDSQNPYRWAQRPSSAGPACAARSRSRLCSPFPRRLPTARRSHTAICSPSWSSPSSCSRLCCKA